MLYFSELKGKKVCTEDDICIGNLVDMSFLVSDSPKITKIVVKGKDNLFNISTSSIQSVNHKIKINKQFDVQELTEHELLLGKNLLDKQIIDISGNKMVRVNDIAINDKPGYYIAGVDIGILGILRWLKVEELAARIVAPSGIKITSKFLSWADIQPLELARGMVILKTEQDKLKKIRPEDLADYLEKINIVNVDRILKSMDKEFAADIINNLNINYQTALFKQFPPEKAAEIISLIDPDEAVDILLTQPQKKREELIAFLPHKKATEINHLLHLARSPIGEKLTTQYFTVLSNVTVKEVLQKIRHETPTFSFLNYVYVLNQEDKLVGVFSLHELLLQNFESHVYKFMAQNVVVIHLTTPEEIALAKMVKYKINALPVIDQDRHMLGMVAFDDLSDSLLDKLK